MPDIRLRLRFKSEQEILLLGWLTPQIDTLGTTLVGLLKAHYLPIALIEQNSPSSEVEKAARLSVAKLYGQLCSASKLLELELGRNNTNLTKPTVNTVNMVPLVQPTVETKLRNEQEINTEEDTSRGLVFDMSEFDTKPTDLRGGA
jgi:hypothetical protein